MGAVFAMLAGFYFWTPKILGKTFSDKLGKAHFWTLFVGVSLTGRLFEQGKRLFSSTGSDAPYAVKKGSPFNPEEFILFFENVKDNKKNIYKELRKKAGVYVFINNKTNDLYVGSSINLTRRMVSYYYYYNSDKPSQIVIIRAMKKYGLDNFSLGIKEFCASNPKICIDLEQKWIDHYEPKFNVLTVAGNSSGYKHNIDTINKLKEKLRKENHPKFGSTTSGETKQAISEGIKLYYSNNSHPPLAPTVSEGLRAGGKGLKGKLSPQYGIGGNLVFCYSRETGEELIFPSINAAKQHFKVRWSLIKKYIDTKDSVTLHNKEWLIQSTPKQKE